MMPQKQFLFIIAASMASLVTLAAEPVINEFMASNQSVYPDNCDFDDYSDWIELYNPTGSPLTLSDYFLTDDLTLPLKWEIPTGTVIPANSYLMIRADGVSAAPGETHSRGYYPWGSTFTTQRYHADFKLSASGESIGIHRVSTPPTENTLIATNAVWKYRDLGTDPGADWMTVAYDDSTWATGQAKLGYGDGDETTVVSYGPDSVDKYPATYFRHQFTVTDPTLLASIQLNVNVDDGAIFYLNDVEVARLRMTDGAKTYLDYSEYSGSDYDLEPLDIPASAFVTGNNVLAVEVHQSSADSSDMNIVAELVVTEIDPSSIVLVDSISNYPAQVTDVSYGRDPTATSGWSYFGEATPEGPNTTDALTELTNASAVTATADSGFYTSGQSVSLNSSGAGETIHYTLDGSVPTSSSATYSTPLTITETSVLRARAFVVGKIPGPTLTRTFFIGESPTLPTFSLIADPDTLFDDTIGIYENSSAYPYKGREVPVRLEMFEADQTPAFAVSAGVRIAGENIWQKAQKPFNVYMRSKYGDDLINYQLFQDQAVATFGEVNLRNGGDDWEETLLRDAMIPSFVENQMEAGLYTYRPSGLFLNGEFWGIYNIRKRFDQTYFANEHALAEDQYDLVKYAHDETGTTILQADAGTTDAYSTFLAFCTTNDTSNAAIYSQIEDQMNIDSFIDYVVGTDYAVNTSWNHNREFWCGLTPGSKWTWILNDCDRGFSATSVTGSLIDNFIADYKLFQELDDNSDFVNRLIQRYAAHLGSTFHPQRISDKLDILSGEQAGEIQRHINRWSSDGGIATLATWQAELAEIKQFAIDRPAYALSRLQLELGISLSMANLTVNIAPSGGGAVKVAGVPMAPEYSNVVSMFLNTPVELTAEAAPGYAFTSWSNGSTDSTIEITMTGAETITANFTAGAETIIPSSIVSNLTLTAAGSPYSVTSDVIVEAGATLTLDAGVQLLMPAGRSILVYGALIANGTESQPIEILARTEKSWGNLSFVNTSGDSTLNYVTIRNATLSRHDPLNLKAAVSGYNSTLTLNHCDIEALQPVFARYGSTTMRNSTIHILFTGDGINVKSGDGLVEDSTFIGNSAPDTDAIDFDDVNGGIIQGNRIYAFLGPNSDAIDVGEGCQALMVSSNTIFNVTDKGISVGQASVAYIERNLIVDCDMGVGVKDSGSTAYIDQNTFARVNTGVASFEKNAGNGGGIAYISNSIFYRSKDEPTFVDSLSTLTVDYSLSDTLALTGTGNLLLDPLFIDAGGYDFSLTSESPAIDTGDPAHALDTDGSRADMGAYYTFDPADYPFFIPNLVVINEVLAHSPNEVPDWIELLNNSSADLDIGGWYLSDNPDVPLKYRIADGTILPGNSFVVFYEDAHFGATSTDAGALIPFALSENGDTVNLFGPSNDLRPDYTEKENFGASERGVTIGRYYKTSSRTFNFVRMESATLGAANSGPIVGPIVISEIMYHAPNGEADYLELTNIDSNPVTLYDSDTGEAWQMTKGINHVFPTAQPIVMEPSEKILLVRNAVAFAAEYSVPAGTRIYQWDSGSLDNGGETLEISMPGDVNNLGERQYIRIDRVDYSDDAPWPTGPDGDGTALARINESAYGNDFSNWRESVNTPGQTSFGKWQSQYTFPIGQDGPNDDPDGDGILTAMEYAIGTHPTEPSAIAGGYSIFAEGNTVAFTLPALRSDLGYTVQKTASLTPVNWIDLYSAVLIDTDETKVSAQDLEPGSQGFFRLVITLFNQ
jgi:hypothetical protein